MTKATAQTYTKESGKWVKGFYNTDSESVYKNLTDALISKKICGCRYIKKIERVNRYDGTQRITIYYDNDVKVEYIIPTH
jgi:hypothetical protein